MISLESSALPNGHNSWMQILLASDLPWVTYRTRLDLLDESESASEVQSARRQLLAHPLVVQLIAELQQWPGTVLSSHKSASQHYHKLAFLADLGLTASDPGIKTILAKVAANRSNAGICRMPTNIPVQYGGTGTEQWAWALCDAPLLLYSLEKMRINEEKAAKGTQRDENTSASRKNATANHTAIAFLATLQRANGWPCAVSPELGNWRGPGRKSDPCPYANLLMLKLLALNETGRKSSEAGIGINCLLDCWQNSLESHPYMFYMGSDFRKLKAPFIWYDLLHVLEVLSQYPQAVQDSRYSNMLSCMLSKADASGLFTPESVWQAWKEWDFGQKKQPSPWLTLMVRRIEKRSG
jgi:hypothetical protein